ncbi:MAG TPA: NAD(P)(+) transhydrogenase (Re/Si-specific) subunit beta, partial [Burkholderiaceae bacterium]|nr:NAD(P)(+) transhydrogenase (Re/Si-specific) subunit beta [Burkholderiaceae bacterium]
EIVSFTWILAGLAIGSVVGLAMGFWVPMTAMPQRTALSHAFGAFAAALVGISEYFKHQGHIEPIMMGALGFEVMLGALTTTGSLLAFAKLQGLVRGTPMTYKGQNVFNMALLAVTVGIFIYLIAAPGSMPLFFTMVGLAFIFGLLLVMPIGSADMPVVMSLLNSYAGLASAATGFVLSNKVLIIAGTLDGFSGFILSILMCRAMNRSIWNVLFGAFGSAATAEGAGDQQGTMREVGLDDIATQLAYANKVVFVPGYGLATAQAQHAVRELADVLEKRGVTVKYGIHPVAGRMPGHMNVLLAEANVPYDEVFELEDINSEFATADVAYVIGANDV